MQSDQKSSPPGTMHLRSTMCQLSSTPAFQPHYRELPKPLFIFCCCLHGHLIPNCMILKSWLCCSQGKQRQAPVIGLLPIASHCYQRWHASALVTFGVDQSHLLSASAAINGCCTMMQARHGSALEHQPFGYNLCMQ